METQNGATIIVPDDELTTDPGLDSHVKGGIRVVNDATPINISEIPFEEARSVYSYVTIPGDKAEAHFP
jgi:hypothetical protein